MKNMTYILTWTSHLALPFALLSTGVEKFVGDNCSKQNCFVALDKSYFPRLDMFDVLLFHGPQLAQIKKAVSYPETRSPRQRYIFVSKESSENYPLRNNRFNNYFNWTWTYKLDSDILYNYITVRDRNWNIIGPRKNMHWVDENEMKKSNLNEIIKEKLKYKTRAAAWFVSNCKPKNNRNEIGKKLGEELKKYDLALDIYGRCGTLHCPVDGLECDRIIQKNYYFYLAFENSRARDYVTEKLVRALNNYAIPVVLGGANYSRFMPDGIYLDASKNSPAVLAKKMYHLVENKTKYYEYFKWHNFYTFHDPDKYPDSNTYCSLCAKITDERSMRTRYSHHDIRGWWND